MDFVARIGRSAIRTARTLRDTFAFAFQIFVKIVDRDTYNSAVRIVLVRQIYFTAVQILPMFLGIAAVFGAAVVGISAQYMKELGLSGFFGQMLMGFVVTEVSPFFTVLLIALRSSSAINTEIAVMKVSRELQTLEAFRIDPARYLFVPRIVNGMVSVTLLSSLFAVAVLLSGWLFSRIIFSMTFDEYATLLIASAKYGDIFAMLLKCVALGFFTVLIPIRFGLSATNELTSVPISVLNGMVWVFIAIVFIEVLSLIATSILGKLI